MIRINAKAKLLAAHVVNPPIFRISVLNASPSSSPLTRSFCAIARNIHFETYKIVQQRLPAKQIVRYCSHRRAMCRHNADIPGGSVHVESGREVLPTNVKPLHYDLTLEPNFDKFSYEGTVVIEYVP